jgi:hypothetical protein
MSAADFLAVAPLLVLAGAATLLMMQIAFLRNVTLTAVLAACGLGLAALSCIPAIDPPVADGRPGPAVLRPVRPGRRRHSTVVT